MMLFRFVSKPWFWVLLGAVMTAGSALTSHYIVSNNNSTILLLNQKVQQIDENIRASWESTGRMERDSILL